MTRSSWKNFFAINFVTLLVSFSMPIALAFTVPTSIPAPPTGVPSISGSGTASGAVDVPEESEHDTSSSSRDSSGGFIDSSQGQAALNPTQYSNQYQGQFFSRITTARDAFAQLSNFMLSFMGAIAIVFIIWGGFLYITASGDQGKLDKAKKVLWGTVMSLIIVFGIYALISTLLNIGAAVSPGVGVGPLQTGPGGTTLRVPF